MPRYRLTLEYDGAPFVGWQRQDNGPSVQGALEEAIEKLSGERVTVTGAGRTDAGVHALGQVAHFDLEKDFEPGKVRDALNHYLRPASGRGAGGGRRGADFHARFSATARHYLLPHPQPPQPAGAGRGPRLACQRRARRRGDARRRRSCWSASMISRPSAPPNARPSRRSRRWTGWMSAARRRNPYRGLGALLPASPGPLLGRHAEAGGRRQMAPRAMSPKRWRRRTARLRPGRAAGWALSGARGLLTK